MIRRSVALVLALCSIAAGCAPSAEGPREPAPAPAPVAPVVEPPAVRAASNPAPPAPSPQAAPAQPEVERASLLVERTWQLGRWPEELVVVGDEVWVAESGARRVARVALDGRRATTHVGVGRLPVQIGLASNGKIYTLAQTDKTIWEIDPKTSAARVRATVSDCPESMHLDGTTAWVLLWSKCSSAESTVARVDLASAKQTVSPKTGANAWGLAVAGPRVWVAHGDGALTSVDAATLQDARDHGTVAGPHAPARVAAGRGAVFVVHGNAVSRADAAGERTHTTTFAAYALAVSLEADVLWVMTDGGAMHALDPETLALRRQLVPSSPLRPSGFARWGDRFLVTVHGDGDAGSLLVLAPAPGGDAPP